MTASNFLQIILSLSVKYELSVTSWIRSNERNKSVGGSENSRHVLGLAVDVVLDQPEDNESFIIECKRQGLIAVDEGDHVHVQTR